MSRIWQITGRNFTGKSTLAISDLLGKCAYAELDAGSFERTATGENPDITITEFYPPLTALEDIGVVRTDSAGKSGGGGISIVHTYKGWQENMVGINAWVLATCADDAISRGIFDTASLLWDTMQNATRQRAQASGLNADQLADRLKTLEFQEPNAQFYGIVSAFKRAKKDLILINHEKEEWKQNQPTGKMIPDGWRKAEDSVDVHLRMSIEAGVITAEIKKAGGIWKGPQLIGKKIAEPTLNKVSDYLAAADKLLRAEIGLPDTEEETLEMAGAI